MKPATAPAVPERTPLRAAADDAWRARSARLFTEFERPAKAMVRRAFRSAFGADELDDIYAGAWVGTLRALADRHVDLSDDEIRSYLLTAVANQASKELRRRGRKPTAPLELVGSLPDLAETPEEQAVNREQSSIARDVLASLPPRRRAVMLLRYGWGLEPSQVCGLISGLSPRAYRKEVTRGVNEVTRKMRAVERGDWCADREPLLKRMVAGVADEDEERQARAHLSHCRSCSSFVARLGDHLHDLGGAVATASAIDGLDGHLGLGDRLVEIGDRATGLLARGTAGGGDVGGPVVATGGARGAGVAGAGVLAKFAGLGAAGKLAVACVGSGVAVTACLAAGVNPLGGEGERRPTEKRADDARGRPARAKPLVVDVAPTAAEPEAVAPAADASPDGQVTSEAEPNDSPPPADPGAESPEVAVTAPPEQQEFSVEAAAVAPPTQSGGGAPAASGGSPEPTETQQAQQEFGP